MYLEPDAISLYVTNSVDPQALATFQQCIQRLLTEDPHDLYMKQLLHNAEADHAGGSGLGILTMLNDYGATIAWKFEPVAPEAEGDDRRDHGARASVSSRAHAPRIRTAYQTGVPPTRRIAAMEITRTIRSGMMLLPPRCAARARSGCGARGICAHSGSPDSGRRSQIGDADPRPAPVAISQQLWDQYPVQICPARPRAQYQSGSDTGEPAVRLAAEILAKFPTVAARVAAGDRVMSTAPPRANRPGTTCWPKSQCCAARSRRSSRPTRIWKSCWP